MKKEKKYQRYEIIKPFLDGKITLKEIAQNSDVSYPTLKRWVKSYKKKGIEGLDVKKRSDRNSFRKADRSIISKIESLYKKNKEKTLLSLYDEVKSSLETTLSFNTFYRIVNNLDSYLKNKSKFLINKNIELGDVYIVKVFLSYHFVNCNGQKKLPIILLAFNASTLDFIDFHIAFDTKFTSSISAFLREIILKGAENYNISYLPKEILVDTSISIPKKVKEQIFEKTEIKILDFEANNKEMDEFITYMSKDLNKTFGEETDYETFHNFFKNYSVFYNLEAKTGLSEKNFEKLNIFLPKIKRKISNYGIRINNRFYNADFLKDYIGKILHIIYNPINFTSLKVYNKKHFINEIKIK